MTLAVQWADGVLGLIQSMRVPAVAVMLYCPRIVSCTQCWAMQTSRPIGLGPLGAKHAALLNGWKRQRMQTKGGRIARVRWGCGSNTALDTPEVHRE